MNATGHMVVGTAFTVAIGAVLPNTIPDAQLAVVSIATIIGSLSPDIDHPRSTLGRYNPLVGLMRHRGHAHSVIGVLVLACPFIYVNKYAYGFAVIAGLSHLLADKFMSLLPGHSKFKLKLW